MRSSRVLILGSFGILWLLFTAHTYAAVTLDPALFPTFRSKGVISVIVPGNWEALDGPKGWIPVRLFGMTDDPDLTLRFTLERAGDSPTEVTLRTRDQIAGQTLTKAEAQGADVVTLAGKISGDRPSWNWWCEAFLSVKGDNGNQPVVINVTTVNAPSIPAFKLILGECWLLVGGPNVGVKMPLPKNSDFVSGTSYDESPASIVAMPKSARDFLEVAASEIKTVPALGGLFAQELTKRFAGGGQGTRPVCVYSWPKARTLISEWAFSDATSGWPSSPTPTPTAPWNGLLNYSKHGPIMPGIRGVIWWHGEWEAEYGNLSPEPMATPAKYLDKYSLDLGAFRKRYADAGVALCEKICSRLARVEPNGDALDSELAKRTIWVVAQSPGAGRKPEFFEVFNPPDNVQPQSSWAVLRAAQFDIVRKLRETRWLGRPMAVLVPLGGPDAGWIWGSAANQPRAVSLFEAAAQRIAQQVFITLTAEGKGTDKEDLSFADGWPHIRKSNDPAKPATLRFSGVEKIEPPSAGAPTPGVRTPQLEALRDGKWNTVPFAGKYNEDGAFEVGLPSATTEVRYGWGDANAGLHERHFKQSRVHTPVPPFHITL